MADRASRILVSMPEDASQWGLVELQGQIETRDQVPFKGMHIGDLHFNSKGVPSLIVGHHLLTGKVQNLEKPFAILRKYSNHHPHHSTSQVGNNQNDSEYLVLALVTKKILFNNRPKPIITKSGIKRKI